MDRQKRLLHQMWGAATPFQGRWRRLMRLALGSLLGLLCLVLVLRNIQLDHFKHDLLSLELTWLLAALVAFAAEYAFRIERWRRMLEHANSTVRWIDCAGPLFASYAANCLLPFRAGDILRSCAFEQILGATPGVVVATLLVERILDLLVLLALLCGVLAFVGAGVFGHHAAETALLTIAMIVGVTILFSPRLLNAICLRLIWVLRLFTPNLAERVVPEVQKGVQALTAITARRKVVPLLVLSATAWVCEGCIFWFAAKALPSLPSPNASLVALPMGALATLIPSTPGYVGTFEYLVVLAMGTAGNPAAAAATYSLLLHTLLSFPSILVGSLYLCVHFTKQPDEIPNL